jgi:hypothetical protein
MMPSNSNSHSWSCTLTPGLSRVAKRARQRLLARRKYAAFEVFTAPLPAPPALANAWPGADGSLLAVYDGIPPDKHRGMARGRADGRPVVCGLTYNTA